jgi:hypothetical protein
MRKGFPAIALALLAVLVSLLAVPATAGAKGDAHKHKKCKGGKVAVTINGRAKCMPLSKALPRPKEADQTLLSVRQALGTELKGLRNRHGRKVPSAKGLLGPKGVHNLETVIKKGLALAEHLQSARSSALSSVAPPIATASAGCGGGPAGGPVSGKFKGDGFSASVDLTNGNIGMAVDGGPNGLRVEFNLTVCNLDHGGFKLPGCPDAEGRLEGSDESLVAMDLKVFEGGTLVLGQRFSFSGVTKIEPVQVSDEAKLEYFEIDHTYREQASISGVSLDFTYHGHARVTYPGASYDPTATDIEARVSVEGIDDQEEARNYEFDASLQAKPKADQIFAAEVDKVIKKLVGTEANWMDPNHCAKITVSPESNSLKPLKKAQKGTFQAQVSAAPGGSPSGANWSLLQQRNGSFTPSTAHANPATFNYAVTSVGDAVFIEVTVKAVSDAGVAERSWIQPTEPDEINHITGTFTVTTNVEGSIVEWSGEATYDRLTPGLSGAMGVYTLSSGTATGVFSGVWGGGPGCEWEGTKTYPLQKENAVTALEVSPGSLEPPYTYTIEATVRGGDPHGIKVKGCEGADEWEAPIDMDLHTDQQVSDDGIHFKGASTESPGPGYTIEQTWDFQGTK